MSHLKMKQLSQNKKSWFNQDIFKEINLSIDEYYNKKNNDENKEKDKKSIKEKKSLSNLKLTNNNQNNSEDKINSRNNDDESYEDASDSEDDVDDHYDTQFSKPIIDKIKADKNLKENVC